MLLKNTREPFDTLVELHPDRIKHLLSHGYVQAESETGVNSAASATLVIRSKGRREDRPPSDLGQLADDISKSEDE